MAEYIEKQKAIKLLDMCMVAAEKRWKEATNPLAKIEFKADKDTIEAMIEVVVSVESADVQPVNQWINVDDRLPESEKEVLVWYKYTWDAGFTSYGFGINVWYSNTKQWRDGCLLKGVEVLYWQPLPEPPKDGDT